MRMASAVESLHRIKMETVDLENIPMEKCFTHRCSNQDLTCIMAEAHTVIFGPKKLEEKKESLALRN